MASKELTSTSKIYSEEVSRVSSEVFSGGRSSRRSERGSDLLYRHSISFEEAFSGLDADIDIEVMSICESCDGSGALTPDDVDVCATCEGHGRLRRMQRVGPFTQQVVSDCPACSGKGSTIMRSCTSCKGEWLKTKIRK